MHVKDVRIADRLVGPAQPVYIVAEVGINHDGDLRQAERLVDAAADAGADAVKFQTIDAEASYVPGHPSHAAFAGRGFTLEQYRGLQERCRQRGVAFFTTPGDWPSLELCAKLGVPLVKVSSGLMTNLPLILEAAKLRVPFVISSGMAHLWEVGRVVQALEDRGARDLVLLHCTSLYPTPPEAVALRAIPQMQAAFPYPVGYSDHTLGATACLGAVALGARMLEKHITLDRSRPGADHHISAEPGEFVDLVRQVRALERMLERDRKAPDPQEVAQRPRLRRSLVARADLAAGQALTPEAVGLMRPLGEPGLPAEALPEVLGRRLTRPLRRHEPLTWDHLTER